MKTNTETTRAKLWAIKWFDKYIVIQKEQLATWVAMGVADKDRVGSPPFNKIWRVIGEKYGKLHEAVDYRDAIERDAMSIDGSAIMAFTFGE